MVGARMVNVFRSTWWMVTWSVLFVMWGGMFPSNPAAEPGKALFTNVLAGVYVVMMGGVGGGVVADRGAEIWAMRRGRRKVFGAGEARELRSRPA